MIGKGRSKWRKKDGGVDVLVRLGLEVDVEVMKVGDCEMSEDILAVNLWSKREGRMVRIVLTVCYMSVESACGREENERKYRLIERVIDECKGDQVIVIVKY